MQGDSETEITCQSEEGKNSFNVFWYIVSANWSGSSLLTAATTSNTCTEQVHYTYTVTCNCSTCRMLCGSFLPFTIAPSFHFFLSTAGAAGRVWMRL